MKAFWNPFSPTPPARAMELRQRTREISAEVGQGHYREIRRDPRLAEDGSQWLRVEGVDLCPALDWVEFDQREGEPSQIVAQFSASGERLEYQKRGVEENYYSLHPGGEFESYRFRRGRYCP